MKRNDVYLNLNSLLQRFRSLHVKNKDELTALAQAIYPSFNFEFKDEKEAIYWHVENLIKETARSLDIKLC